MVNPEAKDTKDPIIIRNGDERSKRLYHLSKINEMDVESIEDALYGLHPFTEMIKLPLLSENVRAEILNRKQQLVYYCSKENNPAELDLLIATLCLESVPLKSLGLDAEILESLENEGVDGEMLDWDHPYIKLNFFTKEQNGKRYL